MDDAFAVSRMRENRLFGSKWREPETEMTVRSSGTLAQKGRNSQGSQDLQHPPRRLPTRLRGSRSWCSPLTGSAGPTDPAP
jgi:hypothetical protein